MDQCQECGYFFSPGEAGPAIQDGCPNCGRPYRDQISPTLSEGEYAPRGMPTSTQDDMSGNPLQEGILADNGWQNRQKRDESFASVRRSVDEFDLGGNEGEQGAGVDVAFPSHTFIVQGDGTVHAAPHPTTHEQIAQTLGDTESHLNRGSLGWLYSNGATQWASNGGGMAPEELQEALSGHFGYPVEVDPKDPNLSLRSQADRFGWGNYHPTMEQEQDARSWRGRPFGYYDNPFINRGGRTADVDFQTDQVALPGHTTYEAQPSEWGLHGNVVKALNQVGAYVNGRQVNSETDPDYMNYLVKHWSSSEPPHPSNPLWQPGEEWEWPQNQGRSVFVSHPDPQRADVARQIVEQGNETPLFNWAQNQESAHPLNLRIPNGVTDNLHKALGNLRAWVENPYENGALRPYKEYHRQLRPNLHSRAGGAVRVGVQNPQMGEILNHVAQTDDLTPLYEYRGVRRSNVRVAGPEALPVLAPLVEGGAEAAGGAAAGGAAGGAGAAAAGGAGLSSSGVGGLMDGAMLGNAKNALQGGYYAEGLMGGGQGQQGGGAAPAPNAVEPPSYYAAYESPGSHDEIPQNEDGDANQKDDGDDHEWQKDYDVNGIGGTDAPTVDNSPQFDSNGTGAQRLMMLLPLIEQFFHSDESGADDSLIRALDEQLESEIPGYKDHGTPEAAQQLLLVLKPQGEGAGDEDSKQLEGEPTKISEGDDSSDEKPSEKESRVDFLPHLPTLGPSSDPHFRVALMPPTPGTTGVGVAPGMPPLAPPSTQAPTVQGKCPHCGALTDPSNTTCPQCGAALGAMPNHQGRTADFAGELPNSFMYEQTDVPPGMPLDAQRGQPITHSWAGETCPKCGSINDPGERQCAICHTPLTSEHMAASHQGPHTPEQISLVQQFLIDNNRVDEVPEVPLHPENYAEELSAITGNDTPPQMPDDGQGGMPQPAQEEAPPGDTMPMPGMSAPMQMASAVERYAADSVAHPCPKCKGHTTEIIDKEKGKSSCHSCGNIFDSDVTYEDAKTAADHHPHTQDPTADQRHLPHDIEQEQDTSHTWVDKQNQPLQVGQYYDLYTKQYDIPDLVRIDAVKPDAITYTLQSNSGLQTSEEVTREEADVMGYTFQPSSEGSDTDTELQPGAADLNNDDNTSFEGSPEMTDMSSPHMMTSAMHEAMTAKDFVMLADCISKLQVPNRAEVAQQFANYLALTNPRFDEARFIAAAIGEPLSGRDQFKGEVPQPQQGPLSDSQPGDLTPPEGWTASASRDWLKDSSTQESDGPGLEWLNDGSFNPKVAGQSYDAWEQRKFIDEDGSARNADKLDLIGTHYEADASDDSFLFGL